MGKEIPDSAAITFSVAFYDAVGAGESIPDSYSIACNALHMEHSPAQHTPVLFQRRFDTGPVHADEVLASSDLDKSDQAPRDHDEYREFTYLPKDVDQRQVPASVKASHFVNRSAEISALCTDILATEYQNKALLLHAPSGVGKSALTERVFSELKNRQHSPQQLYVRLAIPQHARDYREESFYMRVLAHRIHLSAATFPGQIPSFQSHIASRRLSQRQDFPQPAEFTPSTFWHELARLGERDLPLLESYILHCSGKLPMVICVENAQNLDDYSLDFFSRLLQSPRGIYLLLELTEDDPNGWDLTQLESAFAVASVIVQTLKLGKLQVDHAMKILRKREGAIDLFVRRSYQESEGNLRPFIDLEVALELRGAPDTDYVRGLAEQSFEAITLDNLTTLSEQQKFLFALIVSHGGIVPWSHLNTLYEDLEGTAVEILDVEDTILTLQKRRLVSDDGTEVSIAQDQLLQHARDSDDFSRHLIIAFDHWKKIYEQELQEERFSFQTRADKIVMLLVCLMNLGQEYRALPLLNELTRLALANRSIRQLCTYLEKIRNTAYQTATENQKTTLDRLCIYLYFMAGQYQEALRVATDLDKLRASWYLEYRAALLVWDHRHQEAIEFCDLYLPKIEDDPELYLRLKLVVLSAYRCTNSHADCDDLFKELREDPRIHHCRSYAHLLRNAQLTTRCNAEITECMRQSIQIFHELGDQLEEARTRVSITLQLSKMGKHQEALAELDTAERLMKELPSEEHCILNNRAAIAIYMGSEPESAIALLRSARRTATDMFSRLIISMNSLILFTISERYRAATEMVAVIERILADRDPQDLEIRRIAHYNLYLYYSLRNSKAVAAKNLRAAQQIDINFWSQEWNDRLYSDNFVNSSYHHEVPAQFEPTFLCYWTIGLTPPPS